MDALSLKKNAPHSPPIMLIAQQRHGPGRSLGSLPPAGALDAGAGEAGARVIDWMLILCLTKIIASQDIGFPKSRFARMLARK